MRSPLKSDRKYYRTSPRFQKSTDVAEKTGSGRRLGSNSDDLGDMHDKLAMRYKKKYQSKPKEVVGEEAVVDDTPPSKIAHKGVIQRKEKVKEGSKIHIPNNLGCVTEGDVRQTTYRASLNGLRTLMEEVTISTGHKKILRKTPFWSIFNAIIQKKLTHDLCRKSDQMIIRIINSYHPENDGFRLGENIIRMTRADIANIFGVQGGSGKVNLMYGCRDGVEMVKKGRITASRMTSSSLKELVKSCSKSKEKSDMEDFVRLLCAYLLHNVFFPTGTTVKWVCLERFNDLDRLVEYDWCGAILDVLMTSIRQRYHEPRTVTGCVIVLLYWLCEHTTLVKPINSSEQLGIIKWRTTDLVKIFGELQLTDLKSDQVVMEQTKAPDANIVQRKAISNSSTEDADGSDNHRLSPDVDKNDDGGLLRTPCTTRHGLDMDYKDEGGVKLDVETPRRSNDLLRGIKPGIGLIMRQEKLINELQETISKLKDNVRENEGKHASEIASKDQEIASKDQQIASLNDTLFFVLGRNSQLLGELTETVVHGVTQAARPTSPGDEVRSMVTRLKTKVRKDNQKLDYDYDRKRKRSTMDDVKIKSMTESHKVVDVDALPSRPEKEPVKPKPIPRFKTNAVVRHLSTEEKDQLIHMWENVNSSTIIWMGDNIACAVFIEDLRPLILDSALSGNVIDAYASVLSIEQGIAQREMIEVGTQLQNKTVFVFTCSFMALLGCKSQKERTDLLEKWMSSISSYRFLIFPIHFGYHWTVLVLDSEEGNWKFYNSMMERVGVDENYKAAEQLKNQVEHYWKSLGDGLVTTQDCQPIVPIQDCPQQADNSLDCGVIVCYIMKCYFRDERIASKLSKADCHKMRAEIFKSFVKGYQSAQ